MTRRGAAALFVPAPPQPLRATGWTAVAIALVAGTAVSLLRQAGAPSFDTLWAEDGGIFLQGAYKRAAPDALTRPYAGYWHLLPRVVAEVVATLPVAHAAAAIALAAAFVTAAAAVLVWFATAGHVRSLAWRGVLAGLVVLQPAAAPESLNAIALSQWHLYVAVFWLLLWRPPDAAARALQTVAVLLAGLSAPLVVVLVPLALLRLYAVEGLAERTVAVALLAAAAVQAALFATGAPAAVAPHAPLRAAQAFAQWVLATAALGVSGAQAAWLALGPALVPLAAGVAALLFGAGLLRADTTRRWTALAALATAVALFAIPVVLRGVAAEVAWPPGDAGDVGSRYAVAPVLLLVATVALLVPPHRVVTTVLVLALAVPVAVDFRAPTRRSQGPRWRPAVAEAAAACDQQGVDRQRVAIPPADVGWALNVPCGRLQPRR